MSRSLIIAIGGAAALALSAAPALADGYARGQAGAPQARAHHSGSGGHAGGQARVHQSYGHSGGHNWNAASSRNVSRSVSVDVSGGSYSSSYVGRPQVERTVIRSGGYGYGDQGYGYGGYGFVPDYGPGYAGYGATYTGGATSWARPAGQSTYWDYRYRTGSDGARQGFGREVSYGPPVPYDTGGYGARDDEYRDGGYRESGHDRGGRYGYSDGDRYASSDSYSWSSSDGYGDYGYTGSEYGRDDRGGDRDHGRWDGGRDDDRDHRDDRRWDERREHTDSDGRRWECSCRETD